MHIGLVIYGNLDTLTGGFLYDKYLVQHLEHHGHRVEILSLPWRSYGVCLLHNFSNTHLSRLLHNSFDIVLQDELTHPSLFRLNRTLQRQMKFPIVTIIHQVLCSQPRPGWQNAFYRAIETRYFQSVNACIFNSHTTKASVEQLCRLKQPSIVATPGGDRLGYLTSVEDVRIRAHQNESIRLLFLGNVLPNKGLYELIEALIQLPQELWRLTVVGSLSMDAEYVHAIRQLINRNNLIDNIILTGPLKGHELVAHLKNSHVLTMPFSHEGFGIAYLEGMAYGLPAIGSSVGAVKDMIRHERNGFLVESHHVTEFIGYIKQLYQDRELLGRMGEAALESFHAHSTWDDSMEGIHQFLKTLLK